MDLKSVEKLLRAFPDFPKPGILFQDIFPIFQNPAAVRTLVNEIVSRIQKLNTKIDVIVGLDARGFLLGPMIACELGAAFVPVRKRGKLPGSCIEVGYEKEYGVDYFAMQSDAIKSGQTVVIVDDLLATGGSAHAALELIQKLGGQVKLASFIIELTGLNGRQKLACPVDSLFQFDD